jgi:hypothetical protein
LPIGNSPVFVEQRSTAAPHQVVFTVDEGFELVSVLIALTLAVLMVHGFVPHVVVGSAVTCSLIVIAPPFRSEIDSGASVPTLQVIALPPAEH